MTVPVLVAFALTVRLDRALAGSWLWYPAALFIGLPFLILDVAYNATVGTLIWRELPREWTYTQRLKRLKARGHPEAFRQCDVLNRYDPGHC